MSKLVFSGTRGFDFPSQLWRQRDSVVMCPSEKLFKEIEAFFFFFLSI